MELENSFAITDSDFAELKTQIEAMKKQQEYAQLKKDLFDITFKANLTLTKFDGGM